MNMAKEEDVKTVAVKLDDILKTSPSDYYYIKGYIHCLWQKDSSKQSLQSTKSLQFTTA